MTSRRWASALAMVVASGALLTVSATPANAAAGLTCNASTCSQTFKSTGALQSFVVPSWVHAVNLIVNGAAGGGAILGSIAAPGGSGGSTYATVGVAGGSTLSLVVGSEGSFASAAGGSSGGAAGYGGGGKGGDVEPGTSTPGSVQPGAGGGGGSFVFDSTGKLLAAAGGGGGIGGGALGGIAGGKGAGLAAIPTAGHDGSDGAEGGGEPTSLNGVGGAAGTYGAGSLGSPLAGGAGTGASTSARSVPVGGSGGTAAEPGGGGGGGYLAGGGGGGDDSPAPSDVGGGGGGGSGFVELGATRLAGTAGTVTGNGSITVGYDLTPQAITFTSTAKAASSVYGGSYRPAATGGKSKQPVTFTIDASATTNSACTITSGRVSFKAPGKCVIDGHELGSGKHYAAAATARQTVTVTQAKTATKLTTSATKLTARVKPVAPGAGKPTGSMVFYVGGNRIGKSTVSSSGVATLKYTVSQGKRSYFAAVYSGSIDFLNSTGFATSGK